MRVGVEAKACSQGWVSGRGKGVGPWAGGSRPGETLPEPVRGPAGQERSPGSLGERLSHSPLLRPSQLTLIPPVAVGGRLHGPTSSQCPLLAGGLGVP